MENRDVNDYLLKLFNNRAYVELSPEDREKAVFEALETLKDEYPSSNLTPRVVALQTMFMIEGEEESIARLARLGVTAYANKGVSITFAGTSISPAVVKLLHKGHGKKRVGRLW